MSAESTFGVQKVVRLLLVEDDEADARFLRASLARNKGTTLEITHVTRLNDGLALLKSTQFDVVLLDLHLPDASGEICVREIQRVSSTTPIVVLSGQDSEEYAIDILNQGVQDYLVKWDQEGKSILRSIRYAIERKRTELRLNHLANYDLLTQIPNRNYFVDYLKKAVSRAQRNRKLLGLLFLDLDRFKGVNDTLGHHFGDKLLSSVSKRITETVREGDVVARMGGDEFAVLLEDLRDTHAAEAVARKLIRSLSAPYEIENRSISLTISIGVTIFPKDRGSPEALVKNADIAMYQAKAAGRNGLKFFTESMYAQIAHQHAVVQEIQRAIGTDEFFLLYQPQFRLSDKRLDGAEALIRWNRPGHGLSMPNEFIGIAEESGQIVPLGYWVIEEAFSQSASWQYAEQAPHRIAINISPQQIQRPTFYTKLKRLISAHRINPENIELEVTEGCLVQDVHFVEKSLRRLKDLGFTLAIDDFGTGQSCLDYLRRFPIDTLKIDRSFVKDIGVNKHGPAICRAILSLADSLDMDTVAEGIENEEQLDFLVQNGCRRAQGYYFGRPVGSDELMMRFGAVVDVSRESRCFSTPAHSSKRS